MHRTNKRLLAWQIENLLDAGMRVGKIAQALGKSRERIYQIRAMFGLPIRSRRKNCVVTDVDQS